MRNLKRVLALAMALVMILGMMVIGSSAAAYSDESAISVKYADAVEILSGMGIFKGTGTGFGPKQILDRASAAALVYRVITGDVNDKQVDLYDYSSFADVAEGVWYTPYITYAANGGYLKGFNGNAMPNDTVTGIQVLAMMLRAAGYGQNGEFEGAGWKDGILTTAKELGIISGISTNDLDKGASRELVAQLIWNAVNVNVVAYSPILSDYIPVTFATDKVTGAVTGMKLTKTLAQKVFNLTDIDDEDNWGRPSVVYYNEKKGPVLGHYATIEATPDAVYTVATSWCDIAKDLGLRAPATIDSVTTNSVEDDTDRVISLTSMAKFGAQGQLVEFYYNAIEKNYDVVVIDTYLAKVTDVEVVEYDKNGHISDYAELDLDIYTVDTVDGKIAAEVTLYATTDWEYSKNDMLLVYYDTAAYSALKGKPIPYAEIQGHADYVVGTQSAYVRNADAHIVEDVEYMDAAELHLDMAGMDCLDNHNWYFDQYGNLIGATDVRTTNTYATISSIYWQDSFGGEAGYAKAVLTYMDGTQETVKVYAIGENVLTGVEGAGNYAAGNVSSTKQYNESYYDANNRLQSERDYTNRALYKVVPGYYGLILSAVTPATVTIETGVPELATGVVAGQTTQFLVWDEYYEEYATYTGIRNIPSYEDTCNAYYVKGPDGIVDYIFVIDPTDAAENTTATYYHTGNLSVKTTLWAYGEYVYAISGGYVNGKADTILVDYRYADLVDVIENDCANTVVKLSLKNGYVVDVENWADNAEISKATKEKVDYAGAIGAGTAVTTDDATLADGVLTIGGVSYDVVDAAIINAYRCDLDELFEEIDDADIDPNEAYLYVIYKKGTVSNENTKVATLIYVSKKAPGTVGKTATDAATAKLNAAKATAVDELKAYINTKAQAADTTDKLAADFDATTSTETAIGTWTFKALFEEHATADLGTNATLENLAANLAACKTVWDVVDYNALIAAEANKTTVSSAAALVSALASDTADSEITLAADVSVAVGALVTDGSVIDGGNKTVTIAGADMTQTAGEVEIGIKAANGGTIKNITIDGGVTGINFSNATGTDLELALDNVTIVNSTRALNGAADVDITVTDSTLAGKISYIAKTVTFTDTSFVVNEELVVKGNVLEPYTTTVLDGCIFDYGFALSLSDLRSGETITLKNCYVDDVLVTAANVESLLGVSASAVTITNG